MARGDKRRKSEDETVSGELDDAFREAALRPWRAPANDAAGPAPRSQVVEPQPLRSEIAALRQELSTHRQDAARQREAWAAERQTLLARIADLESQSQSPQLAELARGIDGLADRLQTLAARSDAGIGLPPATSQAVAQRRGAHRHF